MRVPVPFEGFAVPSPAYLALLFLGSAAVGAWLYAVRPPVTERTTLAFAPWMVGGATLHVGYRLEVYPPAIDPLFSAPAVYLTTALGMGAVWALGARSERETARTLGAAGTGVALGAVLLALWAGGRGPVAPVVPLAAVGLAAVLTAGTVRLLAAWRPEALERTGRVGALVVFAHLLDGTTTAVGVDLLGASEQSALPARIMELAAGLPTAPYLGSGWLFVAVKLAVAVAVVVAFADYVREEPTQGYLLLALIAAVGLGPGVHNALLFTLSG